MSLFFRNFRTKKYSLLCFQKTKSWCIQMWNWLRCFAHLSKLSNIFIVLLFNINTLSLFPFIYQAIVLFTIGSFISARKYVLYFFLLSVFENRECFIVFVSEFNLRIKRHVSLSIYVWHHIPFLNEEERFGRCVFCIAQIVEMGSKTTEWFLQCWLEVTKRYCQ